MDVTARFFRLPRDENAPARARKWLERRAGSLPKNARSEAVLLGHELVTNATRYSEGEHIWVSYLETDQVVRVEVADEGGYSVPAVMPLSPYGSSGRGLRWVEAMADDWGVEDGPAQEVWFQIELDKANRGPGIGSEEG